MRQVLLACCLLVHAGNAQAQAALDGVSFGVEVLNLTTAGADPDQVLVFSARETVETGGTFTQRRSAVDYGIDRRPVDMRPGRDQSLMWSAGYRRAGWGIQVRRWNTGGEAAYQERVSSARPALTLTPGASSLSRAIVGCRMWDHSLVPVQDTRDPSGFSPVDCRARNALETSKADIVMERVWTDGPRFQAVVRVGAAVGRVEHRREEGQEQNAFIEVPAGTPFVAPFDQLTNRITLDSRGEAAGRFVGPSVELAGRFDFNRLRVEWRVNQSLLIGDADFTGEWIDIDRITASGRVGGISFAESIVTEGRYPLSDTRRAAIPVLDSQVRVSVRVAPPVHAGVGFFTSSWQGVPMAFSWSVPGEWRDDAGTQWRRNESNLAFYGLSVFGQVGF